MFVDIASNLNIRGRII